MFEEEEKKNTVKDLGSNSEITQIIHTIVPAAGIRNRIIPAGTPCTS